jgi:N utilization substance protein B
MTRNEAREIMMQIMYELEASHELNEEAAVKLIESRLSGNHINRGKNLILKIIENIEEIDELINSNSTGWKATRMPKVDLAIIRLAIGEIMYTKEDAPAPVAINEAVELAKKFSTPNSSKFINGILGAIVKNDK